MADHKIIILGDQGSGKSTIRNYISQSTFPNNKASFLNEETSALSKSLSPNNKRPNEIVEIPKLNFGLSCSFSEILQSAKDVLNHFQNGFSVLVYCIPADSRVNIKCLEQLMFLKTLFGEEGLSHVCLMITHLNVLTKKREEELKNIISQDLPKKLAEEGLGAVRKIFFLNTETEASGEFLSSFFQFVESQECISFNMQPINDPLNPFCVLENEHVLKYLDQVTKKYKENYTMEQNIALHRNAVHSKSTEIILRALEVFQAYASKSETLSSMLLRIKGSYVPFLQDVMNYFESQSKTQGPSLFKDFYDLIGNSDNSSKFQKIFGKHESDKLIAEVPPRISEKVLESAEAILRKNLNSDKKPSNSIKERLQTLLGLSSKFENIKTDGKTHSYINFVNTASVASSSLTFLTLARFDVLTAATSTLAMAILNWRLRNIQSAKNARLEIEKEIYNQLYSSEFSKMLFVCMLIIYSDLNKEANLS